MVDTQAYPIADEVPGLACQADAIQGRVNSSPVEISRDGCLPAEYGIVLDPTEPVELFVAADNCAQVCQKVGRLLRVVAGKHNCQGGKALGPCEYVRHGDAASPGVGMTTPCFRGFLRQPILGKKLRHHDKLKARYLIHKPLWQW